MTFLTEWHLSVAQTLPQVNQTSDVPNSSRIGKGFTTDLSKRIEMFWNTCVELWKGFDFVKQVSEVFNPSKIDSDQQRAIICHKRKGYQLRGNATLTYMNRLIETLGMTEQVKVVQSLFAGGNHYDLPINEIKSLLQNEIGEGNFKFISIPIAIDGHITHLLIEQNETFTGGVIEFFDSFGKAMDHPDNHIGDASILGKIKRIFGSEEPVSSKLVVETVRDILSEIKHCNKENFQIIEHETQCQFDVHNCGVFVQRHFEERIKGLSPSKVPENFLDMQNSIEDIRRGMAEFLEEKSDLDIILTESNAFNPDGEDFLMNDEI